MCTPVFTFYVFSMILNVPGNLVSPRLSSLWMVFDAGLRIDFLIPPAPFYRGSIGQARSFIIAEQTIR